MSTLLRDQLTHAEKQLAAKDAEIAALRTELEVTKLRAKSAEAIAGIAPYKQEAPAQ